MDVPQLVFLLGCFRVLVKNYGTVFQGNFDRVENAVHLNLVLLLLNFWFCFVLNDGSDVRDNDDELFGLFWVYVSEMAGT